MPDAGTQKSFKAIAAMSLNRVIGSDGKIPWHLPEDFAWFKQTTMGGVLLMGRKTFESIGKPLPGRETIVLTRGGWTHPVVKTASSPDSLPLAADDPREVFVCGGAEIYAQMLPLCSDLYLTVVRREVDGDALFPEFDPWFELREIVLNRPEFEVRHYVRKLKVKN